mmetsp:Transcript_111756/g.323020  ORF Transcript_111756/g.323020 Transcript_111756/m.323020 type:complete len:208 (-) Transcript_111756:1618-2241(-)
MAVISPGGWCKTCVVRRYSSATSAASCAASPATEPRFSTARAAAMRSVPSSSTRCAGCCCGWLCSALLAPNRSPSALTPCFHFPGACFSEPSRWTPSTSFCIAMWAWSSRNSWASWISILCCFACCAAFTIRAKRVSWRLSSSCSAGLRLWPSSSKRRSTSSNVGKLVAKTLPKSSSSSSKSPSNKSRILLFSPRVFSRSNLRRCVM